jgi:hypothetical protein
MNEQLQNKLWGAVVVGAIALVGAPLLIALTTSCYALAFIGLHWMVRAATGN